MDDFINYVIFFSGTFIGGILTYLIKTQIEHRLAISRNYQILRDTEFNKAAAEFRCAFTDEIRMIEESTKETYFPQIFNEGYVHHYNALIRFQAYLSESDRIGVKKAWDEHCWNDYVDQKESISRKFLHYEFRQGQERVDGQIRIIEETEVAFEKAKQLVSKNLERIFSFAKYR